MPSTCGCNGCRADRGDLPTCVYCGSEFDRDDSYFDDYCSDGCYDRDNAYDDDSGSPLIHDYSFTPDLNFLRADDDPDDSLFLGFELEVPSDDRGELAESISAGPGRGESVLYCKEDSSIDGVEIVSHPMTHKYLRERFDAGMFRPGSGVSQWLREPDLINSGYGLHVHVSRKGFKNQAHALRWMLLIYRNESLVNVVARRTSDQWSSFRDADECKKKAGLGPSKREVENYRRSLERRGYHPPDIDYYVREFTSSGYSGDRYVAVNANNRHTFEVRVFRSTWSELEFRAALDFVHASVTYTREMKAVDALRGGLTSAAFVAWLQDKPEYAPLCEYLAPHFTETGLERAA